MQVSINNKEFELTPFTLGDREDIKNGLKLDILDIQGDEEDVMEVAIKVVKWKLKQIGAADADIRKVTFIEIKQYFNYMTTGTIDPQS